MSEVASGAFAIFGDLCSGKSLSKHFTAQLSLFRLPTNGTVVFLKRLEKMAPEVGLGGLSVFFGAIVFAFSQ